MLSDVTIFSKSIFDAADYLVSNILLPLGALFITIFIPLKMKKKALEIELLEQSKFGKTAFNIWFFIMRYVIPIIIIIVFLDVIGVI